MDLLNKKVYKNNGNQAILQYIPNNCKVLDIGCGAGDNAKILISRGCIVDGITLSIDEATITTPILNKCFVYNLENGLPPEVHEHYDVVLCSHVLEHIFYPQKLLNDIHAILNPSGILIVALPNIMHYRSRWELVKGNFNYMDSGIWDNTHVRWYTFKTGIELFENNGYFIKKATVDGEIPFLTFFKFIPHWIRKKILSALKYISKGFWGYQLIYIVQNSRNQ